MPVPATGLAQEGVEAVSGYPDTPKGSEGCIAPSLAPSTAYQRERCRCPRCLEWWHGYYATEVVGRRAGKRRGAGGLAGGTVTDAELDAQRSSIRDASVGHRQAVLRHAQSVVQRMLRDGVPDAAVVGIALEHLAEVVAERVEQVARSRAAFDAKGGLR
jgi:hypothetical protein